MLHARTALAISASSRASPGSAWRAEHGECAGGAQARPDPVADRRLQHHRQGGRERRPPLPQAARRHRRRPQDPDRHQGRCDGAGRGEAARPGPDRQREDRRHGRRHHALRAHGGAARDRGQNPDRRAGVGRVGHRRALALHGAHELHARPVVGDHRRLGGEERREEDRHHRQRLGARPRSRSRLQGARRQGRRRDRRIDAGAARQSGFRAVPAARPRRQARHPVRLFPGLPGRPVRQAVRRARHGQVGDPHHRPRRPHRRRRAARHDRRDARHRHRASLLGDPRFRRSTRPTSPISRRLTASARTSSRSAATTPCT